MLTSWYHFEVILTSLFQVDRLAQLYNIHLRTGCFCNIGACQMFLNISSEDIKTNLQVNLNIPLPTPPKKPQKTHKTYSQQCMSIAEHKMFVVCPMSFYLLIICLLIFLSTHHTSSKHQISNKDTWRTCRWEQCDSDIIFLTFSFYNLVSTIPYFSEVVKN